MVTEDKLRGKGVLWLGVHHGLPHNQLLTGLCGKFDPIEPPSLSKCDDFQSCCFPGGRPQYAGVFKPGLIGRRDSKGVEMSVGSIPTDGGAFVNQ
jgi:hypothetical protein